MFNLIQTSLGQGVHYGALVERCQEDTKARAMSEGKHDSKRQDRHLRPPALVVGPRAG
jgi:hypothetical protein